MTYRTITVEKRGAADWLTLNRPDQRNAMTFAMYEGLVEQAEVVTKDPAIRARFAALGAEALGGTREELAAMIQEEIARWRSVITAQGITLE